MTHRSSFFEKKKKSIPDLHIVFSIPNKVNTYVFRCNGMGSDLLQEIIPPLSKTQFGNDPFDPVPVDETIPNRLESSFWNNDVQIW